MQIFVQKMKNSFSRPRLKRRVIGTNKSSSIESDFDHFFSVCLKLLLNERSFIQNYLKD